MYKIIFTTGTILAGLGVISGAFASHALKEYLSESALSIWQTAVKYQMYHSLALVLVAFFMTLNESISQWLNISAIAFIVGIILFSGSLYSLALSNVKILGAITPIGGLAFIIGWFSLAFYPWQQ